jgi:intracellular septation protein
MKLICELVFLAIFFAVFKVYGIYPAIASAIGLYGAQLVFLYIKDKRLEKLQIFTFLSVLVLGGSSLLFQNELIFKWKPSVIYWALALGILGAQLYRRKPALEGLLNKHLSLPKALWYRLDYTWATFFTLLGAVNIVVAYRFPTETWVYFKLFGALGALVVFIILQLVWLSPYAKSS